MTQELLLSRSTAEAEGVPSSAILAFLDAVSSVGQELHSLIVVRHGNVIAEGWFAPYAADVRHQLYSLSKSFTSTAAGFAVAQGLIALDDKVVGFFPDDLPETISDNLAAMRVRDLLAMATGSENDTMDAIHAVGDGNWVRAFLAWPVEHAPGSHFCYNTGATYMVSAILAKVTGERLLDYLTPRLLAPLGIAGAHWEQCPRGIDTGGWGLSIKTESIAKFGQLYLQKGMWEGKRLISEEWIEQATSVQTANGSDPNNDWNQGYGFQFWRCRHNCYRADGAFGQYCVVIPEHDTVVATTSALSDMGAVLNLIWEHLLPALGPTALDADEMAQAELGSRLGALQLPLPDGAMSSPSLRHATGRTYRFDENPLGFVSLRIDETDTGVTLTLVNADGVLVIPAGNGEWDVSEIASALDVQRKFTKVLPYRIGAAYAWHDDTLKVKIVFTQTPYSLTLAMRFLGDTVSISFAQNLTFGPIERPELIGVAHK